MAVDTKRQEFTDYYFQEVQNRIKEILKNDRNVKDEDIQSFNDKIFSQEDSEAIKDIKEYIEETSSNAVDINLVANNILDKYYTMVFNNDHNVDSVNDVENPLVEGNLMNFKQFNERKK